MNTPPSRSELLPRVLRVWDLPTRLFHWVFALCVLGAIVTAKFMDDAMVWHFRFGQAAIALLIFRFGWGLFGGHWSRFARFAQASLQALRTRGASLRQAGLGHSLSGWLSTLALLGIVMAQVLTGLCTDDEISASGPWVKHVSEEVVARMSRWHRNWGQWLVFGLVGLHLLAIAIYHWHGRSLVAAMINGDQEPPAPTAHPAQLQQDAGPWPASADGWQSRLLALAWAVACVFATAFLVNAGS